MLMKVLSLSGNGKAHPVQNWSNLLDEKWNIFKKLKQLQSFHVGQMRGLEELLEACTGHSYWIFFFYL